ncbi:MAG: hypothetical protein CH6_1065 [Candidatus Kapaibacterium sp.]|nr:MAG: hypothetical protein CH6_1065 [Candidatus Kapabacteria bacterium]
MVNSFRLEPTYKELKPGTKTKPANPVVGLEPTYKELKLVALLIPV